MNPSDRSRQQSGEGPPGAAQQQGWQEGQARGGAAGAGEGASGDVTQGGRRSGEEQGGYLPAQRRGYEPSLAGGFGGGPFALMRRISDEMDRMFESFGMGGAIPFDPWQGRLPATGARGLRTLWAPHIEVFERNGKLVVQADLPGVRKEDVNVQIEQDRVVIEGERKQESTREGQGFYHTERSYGSFHRVIPLPEGVDGEQAHATFHDGVLEVELPVPQQRQRGRRLTIEDRAAGQSPAEQNQAEGSSERR